MTYEEKPMTIKIPVKVELEVKDAPPAVKGNTVSGGTKLVELVTGAKVDVPLFINTGDIIRINTDSGLYTERVEKAWQIKKPPSGGFFICGFTYAETYGRSAM